MPGASAVGVPHASGGAGDGGSGDGGGGGDDGGEGGVRDDGGEVVAEASAQVPQFPFVPPLVTREPVVLLYEPVMPVMVTREPVMAPTDATEALQFAAELDPIPIQEPC